MILKDNIASILTFINLLVIASMGYSLVFQVRDNTKHREAAITWRKKLDSVALRDSVRLESLEKDLNIHIDGTQDLTKELKSAILKLHESNERLAKIEGQLSVYLRNNGTGGTN